MKKLFLLIPALLLSLAMSAENPTITIDGNKSDWADVPMLTEPGAWPMLKVLPAADASMGTNALAFMLEDTTAFTSDWSKYPGMYLDKDHNYETGDHHWTYPNMGTDFTGTTGMNPGTGWIDFQTGKSADYKVIEIGVPSTCLQGLGEKFDIGMYYGTGGSQEWFVPKRSGNDIDKQIGLFYKTRSYTTLPGVLTAANAFAHNCIGECTDYVDFGLRDNGNDTARWAAFPIELTTPAKFDLTVNAISSNSWSFEFWVVDVATNEVVQHIDNSGDISSSKTAMRMGVLDLTSVPAGKYMLKVKNKTRYSKVKLYKIILTPQNGAVSNLPCTLVPQKATMTAKSYIDALGDVDTIRFYSPILDQEVKWKVNIAAKRPYQFTANTFNKYGHNYKITILNEDESQVIQSYQEKEGTGVNYKTGHVRVKTPTYELAPANYVIKIQNLVNADGGRLTSIETNGSLINIPDTLKPTDAILSDSAGVVFGDPNYINFKYIGSHKYNNTEWAKWYINVDKEGYYAFTLNANSTNSHSYLLSVLQTNETLIESYPLAGSSATPMSKTTDKLWLTEGEYLIKVENTVEWSEGVVTSVVAKYEGGAVTTLPGELQGKDAMLYKYDSKYMIRTEEGYLQSHDNSKPSSEWAIWNITATAGNTLDVTLNLDPVTSHGHNYRIELYNGDVLLDYTEELATTDSTQGVHSKGNIPLEKTLVIPAAGDYTIKLVNRTRYSSMILQGITFTPYVAPAALEINEAATDNSAWIANVGGAAANVQLIRTFKGGVYNSICVPFEAPMSKIKAAFGDDVELLYLEDANMSGDILNLVFANAPDFYQGTPYLIKPSADVVNPEFANVNLLAAEAASTSHTGWPASFKGTFVKQTIDANENNLYLGTDNKLYFSNNDVTIKGLRAYFNVNIPNPQQVIKHARIVTQGQVVTDVELVGAENQGILKTIENGQVIIIRDGIRYNVMGTKIQ